MHFLKYACSSREIAGRRGRAGAERGRRRKTERERERCYVSGSAIQLPGGNFSTSRRLVPGGGAGAMRGPSRRLPVPNALSSLQSTNNSSKRLRKMAELTMYFPPCTTGNKPQDNVAGRGRGGGTAPDPGHGASSVGARLISEVPSPQHTINK